MESIFFWPLISVQLKIVITAMEHLFDKSATWACLIWEKSMKWIPWKMEGRNVLSQTNSTSHRMPVLSCAQLGEYTYKNISCKVEKYNSTFDFHHPFYFFLFCLFGLFVTSKDNILIEMFVQKNSLTKYVNLIKDSYRDGRNTDFRKSETSRDI